MNVYARAAGRRRLIGRACVPWDHGPILIAGAACEQFALHDIRCPGQPGAVETAVLVSPWQRPELLPGWRPIVPGLPRHRARVRPRRAG